MINIKLRKKSVSVDLQENEIVYFNVSGNCILKSDAEQYDFFIHKCDEKYYLSVNGVVKDYNFNNINISSEEMVALSEFDVLKIGEKKETTIIIYIKSVEERKSDVRLPFSIPVYCTYPQFTAILGILSGYKKEKEWVYNNYILLWADKYIISDSYWTDFKYANEDMPEEFCPLVLKRNRGNYENNNDFINTVKNYVDNKIYFLVSIDMFNVDEWWGENGQRYHYVHQIVIFGYNDVMKTFLVADFFNGKYQVKRLSYDVVSIGYFANNSGNDKVEQRFSYDVLLKYNNCDYGIDIDRIAKQIKDFVCSQDTVFYNYLNICKEGMVVYGIEFIRHLGSYVKERKNSNLKLDIRPFQFLYEMNLIMKNRMHYLEESQMIVLTGDLKNMLQSIVALSEQIRDTVLKIEVFKAVKYYFKLEKQLEVIVGEEERMMRACYKLLTGKEVKSQQNQVLDLTDDVLCDLYRVKEILKNEKKALELMNEYDRKAASVEVFDHYNYNVLPFESEMRGEKCYGQKIEAFRGISTEALYKFDVKGNLLMHCHMTDEICEYRTFTIMLYEYKKNERIRYGLCYNQETKKMELKTVDVYVLQGNKYKRFYRASKGQDNICGSFVYENDKICECKYNVIEKEMGEEIKGKNYVRKIYYTNGGELKQILEIKKNGEKKIIYPIYGNVELDYYAFKIELLERLKVLMYESEYPMKKIYINIETESSKIMIQINWADDSEKIVHRYFMKNYAKDSKYKDKLQVVVIEVVNQLINTNEYVKKKKMDTFFLEVMCDKVGVKKYHTKTNKEMEFFLAQ